MNGPEGRQLALLRLMQRIYELDESGRRAPCVNPRIAHWWTSEDPEMQVAAAAACSTCPALRDCRAYVENFPEVGGIWAGVTPDTRGRR